MEKFYMFLIGLADKRRLNTSFFAGLFHRFNSPIKYQLFSVFIILVTVLNNQLSAQVSTYTFSQTTGAYTTLVGTGAGAAGGAALNDDGSFTTTGLPFAFTYNGTTYPAGTTIGINTNGFITIGAAATSSYTSLNSTNLRVIAAFNRDLQEQRYATTTGTWTLGSTTMTVASAANWAVGMKINGATAGATPAGIPAGTIVTAIAGTTITMSQAATAAGTGVAVGPASALTLWTTGTAPNRSFVFQWAGYRRFGAVTPQDNYNFQIWLNESGGNACGQTVQVRYGTCTSTSITAITPMVGINGAAATDFNSRQMGTWAASIATTLNTQTMSHSNTVFPASGTIYTWTPAVLVPTALTASAITANSATISWTAPTPAPSSGYQYYLSTSPTAPTGATVPTGSTAAGVTSVNLTGLTVNTTYYFWVRSNCGGTLSAWAGSGTFSTVGCAGTPTAGTAASTSATVCTGVNFTLSNTGQSAGPGITYVWQSSPNNSTWTNIGTASGTYNALTTTQTAATYYRLLTNCTNSGLSAGSASVFVNFLSGACQCVTYPAIYASSTADEDISNVTVGTMNNSSTCATVAAGAGSILNRYSNYAGVVTGPSADQSSTVSFSLTMTTCGGSFSNFFQIYVDWNQDGDFLDAGEQVYSQAASVTGNQTVTGTFTVPATATLGTTRMRVVVVETTASTTNYAQTAYTWGETEDYCFTVTAPPPCSGTPATPTAAISTTSGCSGVTVNLSATGLTAGVGISYQWQSSPNGTAWTNITGATTGTLSQTPTATTYYRIVTTCSSSGLSSNSNAVSYTVNLSGNCQCLAYCATTNNTGACITNVTFNTINNTSTCSAAPAYYTFAAATTSVEQGATYPFSVSTAADVTYPTAITSVWIDWNQNGVFEATEWYQPYTSAVSGTINITVPAGATLGSTRMRVRSRGVGNVNGSGDACTTMGSGETEDYCLTVTAPVPCSGTPAGGTSSASSTSVCSGVSFTVSNASQASGLGITYQWQSSANNSTWSNVGASSSTYSNLTVTQTASTYYRLLTTCTNSGLSAGSTSVLVNLISGACQCQSYCASSATSTADDEIFNVTLGTLNNSSTCATLATGPGSVQNMYSNYAGIVAAPSLLQGTSYPLSVTVGMCSGFSYSGTVTVYIDFNQNGLFTDAGELVYTSPYTSFATTGTTVSTTITIPAGATPGITRMRVVEVESSIAQASCGTFTWGETEDYCVNITVPPACSGTPSAGTATISSASGCVGGSVNLSATGLSSGFSGFTYQWQSASSAGGPWSNIAGATTNTTTQSPALGTTFYRLQTTCTNSGLSNNTNSVSVTVVNCISTNVPATGNNTVPCGNSTFIYDSGGSAGDYGNLQTGYTVLENSGLGVINLSGSWTYMETSFDYLRIYSGVGTGGTLLATYNGSGGGTITPITTTPGQALTIEFTSDGSVVGAGFSLQALYSGDCNACTGTPSAGTAAISASSGCASVGVNLTASGLTSGTGITYQWQSSPNGTTWTNIGGATLSAYSTTPTATTYYRISTTCSNSGLSNTSNAVVYTVNLSGLCACGNYPNNYASNSTDEEITNVTVGTMNNSSTCATLGSGPGSVLNQYSNFTGSVTGPTAQQTTSVSFSLTQTSCGVQDLNFFQIYIDWNQDGDFLDAGEQVYSQAVAATGNQTVTGTFTVPLTSTLGTTRMRVISIGSNASTTNYAHNTFTWGETEDYCFTVTSPPPCAAPTGLTVSALTTTSATVSWTAVSGATSYQYYLTTSATAPTAGTTPTGTTASTSVNLTSLTPYTTYYFWVRNDCGYGQSSWTGTTFQPSNPICLNTNGYSIIAAGNNNCPIVNTSCDFQDGFVEITGIVTGRTYNFDFLLNGVSDGWITIRSGSFSGPAVWSGAAPITNWTSTITGSVFVHFNTNSNCDQAIVCGFSSVQCVSCASGAASNDLICNATNISCNSTVSGTTICATNSGTGENQSCGVGQARGGVWYKVTGTGDVMTASLCNNNWDSKISVFSGSCAAPVCVGGNDDDGPDCTGSSASYSWTSVPGTDYFILVHGFSDDNAFSMELICLPPDPTSVTASNTYVCSAGPTTVTLTANGAYGTVYWFTGGCGTTGQIATGNSITVTPTATTTYYARNFSSGQFSQNCASVSVNYYTSPSVAPSFAANPLCSGQSTLLNANATTGSGAISTYAWNSGISGNTNSGTVNSTGTYTVTVTDNLGCTASASSALTVNALPTVAPAFTANPICSSSSATLNANATAGSGSISTYAWSSGISGNNASGNVTNSGTYTVTVTNSNGCTATATSSALTVNTIPSVSASASSTTVCEGSNVTLTGSGATSYSWSGGVTNGQAFAASASTTSYNVTGTDANGCTATGSVNLVVNTVSTVPTITSIPGRLCPNTSSSVSAGGGVAGTGSSLRWYSGPNGTGTLLGTGSSISLPFAASTTVYVRREGACNNTADVSTTIDIRAFMTISANSATTSNYCVDDFGWGHWYDSNDEIIFSAKGDFSMCAPGYPQVVVSRNSANSFYNMSQNSTSLCANNLTPGEMRFEMGRSWNLDMGGATPSGLYSVRFYFLTSERSSVITAAADTMSNAAYTSCGYSYKYNSGNNGWFWFKNQGTAYVAPQWQGVQYDGLLGTTSNSVTYVEMDSIPSFSGGSGGVILVPNSTLPISWKSFTGETDNKVNYLKWITATEENTELFEVQRSADGINFETIGLVAAAGSSTSDKMYNFYDNHPIVGINYYRLRMVELDGTSDYSNVIALEVKGDKKPYVFYPNPVTEVLTYQFTTEKSGDVIIEVMDALGRVIRTENKNSVIGSNQLFIDMSNLIQGTYSIRVRHLQSAEMHTDIIIKK